MILKNIHILIAVFLLTFAMACQDMNYLHKDILDEGEIVYAARVDSVFTGAGHNRVAFKITINTQKIETLRFFWNNKSDSVDMLVNNQTGIFNYIIEGLEEKEYIFDLVSLDVYGNKSLSVEAVGKSLGELYTEALAERKISGIRVDESEVLHIEWVPAETNMVKSVFTYPKKDGTIVSVDIDASENSLEITDFMYKGEFTQQTYYKPEELSPDLFTTVNGTKGFFPDTE